MHLFITILPAAFVLLLASLWCIQGGHAAEELYIPTPSERRARRVPVLLLARWTGVSTYVRARAETVRQVRLAEDPHLQLTMPAAMDAEPEGCESRSRDRYRWGRQRRPSTRARLPALWPPARAGHVDDSIRLVWLCPSHGWVASTENPFSSPL